MALDTSGVEFSSNWEIDGLYTNLTFQPFTFPVGSSTLYTPPAEYQISGTPVFEAVYRVGTGNWQQFGKDYQVFATPTGISLYNPYAPATLTVRLYVYTDKMEY